MHNFEITQHILQIVQIDKYKSPATSSSFLNCVLLRSTENIYTLQNINLVSKRTLVVAVLFVCAVVCCRFSC